MEYTVLGRTGLRVSRVGFGGGGIGQVWGPTTEAESVRAIHRALELGVNFFDVAPAYGQGTAEAVLGRALQGRQEPVVVATKVRLAAEEMHDIASAVRTSVEASLRRLRRETVDVLHIHNRFTPGGVTGPMRCRLMMPWAQYWRPTTRCNTQGRPGSLAYRPWNRMCRPCGAS
jgi:aryl-alcohol dehydrogenase-like predicted oxidoreductase